MTENQLVNTHLGLVIKIVKSFNPKDDAEMQDLIQEGSIALLKAIRAYNPAKGKISTFAWKYISKAVNRYKSKLTRIQQKQDKLERTLLNNQILLWEILPDSLTLLEATVVKMKGEGYTFQEIGDKIGYTKSWISRVFNNAKTKIIQANE
jgi:RNA polymerase sigma factor (sigma-70 family)